MKYCIALNLFVCRYPDKLGNQRFNPHNGQFLHDTAIEILGPKHALAVVSGPSFAAEVAAGLPTALTVASRDTEFAKALANALHGPALRAYTTEDVLGVQVGGTVKTCWQLPQVSVTD